MATDIERARRAKHMKRRMLRRASWWGDLGYDFELYAPPGALGRIAGCVMMLIPPLAVVAFDKLRAICSRRRARPPVDHAS